MKLLYAILLVCISLIMQGCVAPGSVTDQLHVNSTTRNGVNVALIPADYREVYFSATNSTERHCRAPDPDFTVQEGVNFKLGANTGVGGSESAGIGTSQSSLSLGGRSATVLIARELMYRVCELTTNIRADDRTTLNTYTQFLDVIERITSTHLGDGTAIMENPVTPTAEDQDSASLNGG